MTPNAMNTVQLRRPKRNRFDLSHTKTFTCKFGKLYPIYFEDCIPGDSFNIGCDMLIRMQPMLAPVIHRMNAFVHYFFVPYRLVWPEAGANKGWQKFITLSADAGAIPTVGFAGNAITAAEKEALDYFGINPDLPNTATVYRYNCMPFAGYQMIWNEYYRDQNTSPTLALATCTDGSNDAVKAQLVLLRLRCWEHDYFTSSLPSAQKGGSVDIPLGVVELSPDWATGGGGGLTHPTWREIATGNKWQNLEQIVGDASQDIAGTGVTGVVAYDPGDTLEVGSTTINDLRIAYAMQSLLERLMLGGSRYTESIWSMFGVKSPDARLQRPEYITGVKQAIVVSEVLDTAGQTDPVGALKGHGVSFQSGHTGSYYCQEHGMIIGILSIMPKTAYQQGIPRFFSKSDAMDFYFPQFAHLGEQQVMMSELYAYGANHNNAWGYQSRYMEYKTHPSSSAGDIRGNLDFWTLTRKFAVEPSLNVTFKECDPADNDRIFAVQDGTDYFVVHLLNKIKAYRPMPVFGTPSTL